MGKRIEYDLKKPRIPSRIGPCEYSAVIDGRLRSAWLNPAIGHKAVATYPGEDWSEVEEIILIVSTEPFRGSIVMNPDDRFFSSSILGELGIGHYDCEREIYFAIEIYED